MCLGYAIRIEHARLGKLQALLIRQSLSFYIEPERSKIGDDIAWASTNKQLHLFIPYSSEA